MCVSFYVFIIIIYHPYLLKALPRSIGIHGETTKGFRQKTQYLRLFMGLKGLQILQKPGANPLGLVKHSDIVKHVTGCGLHSSSWLNPRKITWSRCLMAEYRILWQVNLPGNGPSLAICRPPANSSAIAG